MQRFFRIMIVRGRAVCQEMRGFMRHYEIGLIENGIRHKSGEGITFYDAESGMLGNLLVKPVPIKLSTSTESESVHHVNEPSPCASNAQCTQDESARSDMWMTQGGKFIFTTSPVKATFLLWGVHYNLALSGKCLHK